jgi:hypothetical protein
MNTLTALEIIMNLLFLAGAIGAIVYGIIGWKQHSKRELWWSVMGFLTILVLSWSDVSRHVLLPNIDIQFLFWSRQAANLLLLVGWISLAYKMGYVGKRR